MTDPTKSARQLVAAVEALTDRELLGFLTAALRPDLAPLLPVVQAVISGDRAYDDIVAVKVKRQVRLLAIRENVEDLLGELPVEVPGWAAMHAALAESLDNANPQPA